MEITACGWFEWLLVYWGWVLDVEWARALAETWFPTDPSVRCPGAYYGR